MSSFVNVKNGVWDSRKISIFGVARSVVSQLKSGQDLTRISLPSVFLTPFSMLELAAARYMGHLAQLEGMSDDLKPVERMVIVIRWFLAAFAELDFEKKPYNPVLGETHQCSVKIPLNKKSSEATFIGEQVLHHPPVTAFAIHHPDASISIEGNVSFGVKFHGNSVSCDTKGFSLLNWDNKEHYRITKGLPDVMISNVIIGSRAMSWSGTVEIACAETGYSAKLNFKRKRKNCVVGEIFHPSYRSGDQPLYCFEGCWADEPITAQPAEDGMDSIPVFDKSEAVKADSVYLPSDQMPATDSLKVWYEVSKAISEDNLQRADEFKQLVENAQRARVKEGAEAADKPRKYFVLDKEGVWRWNGKMYNDKQVRVLDTLDDSEISMSSSSPAAGSQKSDNNKKGSRTQKKRRPSATTSASMSTSTDFSAMSVSETDWE